MPHAYQIRILKKGSVPLGRVSDPDSDSIRSVDPDSKS
jgi:hypothetical protein